MLQPGEGGSTTCHRFTKWKEGLNRKFLRGERKKGDPRLTTAKPRDKARKVGRSQLTESLAEKKGSINGNLLPFRKVEFSSPARKVTGKGIR